MQNAFSISGGSWWLLAGLCVALPLLIHLIQLFRHQKVRWAAMAFLLRSQKRNRRWIRIKQWLLIATRILLLLLGLLTISQVRCDQSGFADYFGNGALTHHLVLLDNSFSMEEAVAGGSAKSRATDAIGQLLTQLETKSNQRLSLMTFSQANRWRATRTTSAASLQANSEELDYSIVKDQVVTKDLSSALISTLETSPPSYEAAGPEAAVQWALSQLNDAEVSYIVHVVSDFRKQQWHKDSEVWQSLKVDRLPGQWNFVDCAEDQANPIANLGIVNLEPVGSLNTIKTGFQLEVAVCNYSAVDAKNCVVSLEVWQNRKDGRRLLGGENIRDEISDGSDDWQRSELPAVLFEEIPAGQTVRQSFPLSFSEAGVPVVQARLPDDALAADNVRQVCVMARSSLPLLVVDDALSQGSWYLEQSLNPAGLTGIECKIESSATLRRISREVLDSFKLIALVDLPRLDDETVDKLRDYVANGGGLVWFVGPKSQSDFYNGELYDSGLFPLQLDRAIKTPERISGDPADLQVADHPIFAPFLFGDQSQLDAVVFQWIWKVDLASFASSDAGTSDSVNRIANAKVLASFRGKSEWPLFLEHQLRPKTEGETGETLESGVNDSPENQVASGRIITVLSTCDGQWNNWPQELTFPAMVMLLADYAARPEPLRSFVVGDLPDELNRDFPSRITAVHLADGLAGSQTVQATKEFSNNANFNRASPDGADELAVDELQLSVAVKAMGESRPSDEEGRVHWDATIGLVPGTLDGYWTTDGQSRWERWISNVKVAESNLERSDLAVLEDLDPERTNYVHWNQLLWEAGNVASLAWLRPLILGLLLLLLLESVLALWTSGVAS